MEKNSKTLEYPSLNTSYEDTTAPDTK